MKKILHVVTSLDPGGMENGVVNVANALHARNAREPRESYEWEIHVACLERRGVFAERLPQPENVVVLGKKSGFSLGAVRALRSHIKKLRPDIIHSHNLGPLIYAALATNCGRIAPILQGEHAQFTDEERTPKRLQQRRWLYRCCRKIHTVSHGQREELLSLGFPEKKIAVIINGVDTARFSPGEKTAAREQIGFGRIGADALFIGIVGRFGPFKGHKILLESFESLADEMPSLHLLIVGSGGPEKERVEQQVAASAHRPRIHLAGFQKEPAPFYRSIDLLVVPSTNEGLSNAVLEAMACGVPALAHAACGNAEVIRDGEDGFVAPLDSREKLRAALRDVLKDRARLRHCGENARRKIVENFSMEKMTDGYANLYHEICGA